MIRWIPLAVESVDGYLALYSFRPQAQGPPGSPGHFGNAFLTRFECSKLDSPVLNGMSLIDTPGVLSGEKQRIKRGYEFEEVVKWFADRVDMILVLFDAWTCLDPAQGVTWGCHLNDGETRLNMVKT